MMRALSFCLAAMLTALPGPAAAGGKLPALKLPAGSEQHDLSTSSVMNGVRLRVRVLDIAGPIHEALQDIAMQFDPPLHALPHGEGWILARSPAVDWLVVLSPRGHRTFGVLSSLIPGGAASVRKRVGVPAWLPAGVVQRMALQSVDRGRISTQRVFTHVSLSESELARQVFGRLARTGWTSAGVPAAISSFWVHGDTEMTLSIVPAAAGSGMLSVTTSPVASWPSSGERAHEY